MGTVEVGVSVETEKCDICQFPRNNHNFKHEFSMRGEGLRVKKAVESESSGQQAKSGDPDSQGSIGIALRGDPILRLALIRKGVISADDLTTVEAELRASGAVSSGQ